MKHFKCTLLILCFALLAGCGGSGGDDAADEQKPTITINSPSTSTMTEVKRGENLEIRFTAKDNVGVKSYTVNVSLTKVSVAASLKVTPVDFSFIKTAAISGTSKEVILTEEIPANTTTGTYNVKIDVSDTSGNTQTAEVSFSIIE